MIEFGKRIELFVDEYLIEQKNGLSFRLVKPKELGCAVSFEQPWEGLGSLGMTVIDEGDRVLNYTRGFPTGEDDYAELQTSCLSVSEDGLTFTPYPVNEIEYLGIKDNNIVKMDRYCHNFAPFYDTNPNCKPDERYKAIGGSDPRDGIHAFVSPDGIHWRDVCGKAVITKGVFDSCNMAFYNPETQLYHCYSRYWYSPDRDYELPDTTYTGVRAIQSCTSPDFIHWSAPKENRYAEGHPTDELYTNATRPVPGAEHILLSIPMRFHPKRHKVAEMDSVGVSDAVLMTSRDGIYWDRTVKEPWLSGDLYPHQWTQRNFITAGGIVCRNDCFYFYVEKHYMWDDDGLWVYSVPKYRLMSLHADGNGGSMTSKPMKFASDDIFLNYSTSAYGFVKVTLLDENGDVIFQSGELYGNELSDRLHVDGLAGKSGRLLIELKEADLYAIGSEM